MTKVRLSVSVDEFSAARIRDVAAERGEDVSAFVSRAAMAAVREHEHSQEVFADLDARISAMEAEAAEQPVGRTAEELPGREREEINAFWDSVLGTPGGGHASSGAA